MKSNILRGILGALALLLVVPFAAWAQKEVVVWHGYRGSEKAAFDKVVDGFNKANAGKVKVTAVAVPPDTLADRITTAVPQGQGPDVFLFAQDHLGGWVSSGKTVAPLDSLLDPAVRGRYFKATLDAMTLQGAIYGLPLDFKTLTLIYNKKLVPVPPKTTAELAPMAKRLTDVPAGKFGLAYWYSDPFYHSPLMNGYGGGLFGGRKPTLNSAQNVASLNLLLKWIDRGFMPPEPSAALVASLFNSGKAAMVISGPRFLGDVSRDVDLGLAPLPLISELGNKPMRPWMIVDGVYVAAPSKNKDAAFAFAKYLTDAPAAKVLALEGRQIPANKDVYGDPQIAADPILKAFRRQVDVAVPMPNVPEMPVVWPAVSKAMNAVVKKSATPKAALDQAQKDVLALLGHPAK
jgi:arabinogalactan oligomer/maltooligosaccharide transport system substrate-binding protein